MPQLNPYGAPVEVGGIVLRTPGLEGTATAYESVKAEMRGPEEWSTQFDEALAHEGLEEEYTVAISDTREVSDAGQGMRSTTYDAPAIEVDIPAPGERYGQILLTTDEAGVISWNVPAKRSGRLDATRGEFTQFNTYVVRRYVPEAWDETDTRGLGSAVGRKLLKALVFPIVEEIGGRVGDYFAHRWEEKKRPYRLRGFDPDSYTSPEVPLLDGSAWKNLGAGRALLLLHGTFSRAHTGFGSFAPDVVAELHRRYEGRVFAFDHYTISEDPRQNVDWLLRALPDDVKLDVDVLTHSRGGLVARVLAERQAELSLGARQLTVRRVVFTATPNSGTVLADAEHHGAYIDTMTNLLQFAPDNGVTEVLESIITVAKHLAVGAVKGLEGLQSMRPGSEFLVKLNSGARVSNTAYYALASDFEPANHGWKAFVRDRLTDAIFDNEQNDLVVPTAGVYGANQSGFFPIDEPLVFARSDGIAHSDFFRCRQSVDQLLTWLQP